MDLPSRFLETAAAAGWFPPGATVVAACSGGGDSTALMLLLDAVLDDLELGEVVIAHLDHGLHERSQMAARHVEQYAGAVGMRCISRRVEIVPEQGESLEEAARRKRYAFLAEVATETGAHVVVTGHTMDDQAETVLFRALTGTGVRGLAGIPAVRPLEPGSDVNVVRPLLGLRRVDLRRWLDQESYDWMEDPTNRDGNVRARLRNRAFPVLAKCVGRDPVPLLARLAENAAGARQALERMDPIADAFVEDEGGATRIAAGFERLPSTLRARALAAVVARLRCEDGPPDAAEIRRLDRLLAGERDGPIRGVRVARAKGSYLLDAVPKDASPVPTPPERELPVPGAVDLPEIGARVEVELHDVRPDPFLRRIREPGGHLELIDAEAVEPPITVRCRRDGDRFHPLGAEVEARLTHFLARRGVVSDGRGRVPLVCDSRGIVWVAGHGIAHRCRVTDETQSLLLLRLTQ